MNALVNSQRAMWFLSTVVIAHLRHHVFPKDFVSRVDVCNFNNCETVAGGPIIFFLVNHSVDRGPKFALGFHERVIFLVVSVMKDHAVWHQAFLANSEQMAHASCSRP